MNELTWVVFSRRWLNCVVTGLAIVSLIGHQLVAADKTRPQHKLSSSANVPPSIAAEASRRGIALANIKLEGDSWVGCSDESANAACIVLGKAHATAAATLTTPVKLTGLSKDTVLDIHQYGQAIRSVPLNQSGAFGQVTRAVNGPGLTFEIKPGVEARVTAHGRPEAAIDTLPRYRREGVNLVRTKDLKLVRDTIDARADEPFTVIVTVPALCEPCRRLDKTIHENVGHGSTRLLTKVFILEYFAFADAERELLGPGAVFPTTLVYGVEPQPRKSLSRLIGNLRGSSMEEISRPLAERFRRGSPHTMSRGVVAQELLFQPATERLSFGLRPR